MLRLLCHVSKIDWGATDLLFYWSSALLDRIKSIDLTHVLLLAVCALFCVNTTLATRSLVTWRTQRRKLYFFNDSFSILRHAAIIRSASVTFISNDYDAFLLWNFTFWNLLFCLRFWLVLRFGWALSMRMEDLVWNDRPILNFSCRLCLNRNCIVWLLIRKLAWLLNDT